MILYKDIHHNLMKNYLSFQMYLKLVLRTIDLVIFLLVYIMNSSPILTFPVQVNLLVKPSSYHNCGNPIDKIISFLSYSYRV